MKVLNLFLMIGMLSLCVAAQTDYPRQVNIAFTYGVPGPDYVAPEKEGAQIYEARIPHYTYAKNFKSFAIQYKCWSLMGDFALKPEFYWELDPILLKGKTREVSFHRISKYPSLVKRYNAIRPSSVNFLIYVEFDWVDPLKGIKTGPKWTTKRIGFKVKDINLGYQGSRSAKNITTPTTLLHWKDGVTTEVSTVAFTPRDRTDEEKVKNILKEYTKYYSALDSGPNVFIDVKWPEEVIDQIAIDYDKYEKEGKDLDKQYDDLKQTPRVLKKIDPNADMSMPFEDVPKTAEPFKRGNVVGLRSKGKTVFESKEHYPPEKLDKAGSYFAFPLKNATEFERKFHIIDAAGKMVDVGGHRRFFLVSKGETTGTFALVGWPDDLGNVYTSVKAYYNMPSVFSPDQFEKFKRFDNSPPAPGKGSGGLSFTFRSYWFTFMRGKLLIVDSRFRLLSIKDVFIPSGQTAPKIGQSYIAGGSYTN